jgi:hypothetical protein
MQKRHVFYTLAIFFVLFFICQDVYASQYRGKVVGVSRQILAVQGQDGRIIRFAVGWRTRYYPNRLPMIGERVRVEYKYGRRGYTGYRVTIIRHSPPPVNVPEITLSGDVFVIVPKANVRSGPGTRFRVVATAREREILPLKGQTGSWYLVDIPAFKTTGWIYADLVRINSRIE